MLGQFDPIHARHLNIKHEAVNWAKVRVPQHINRVQSRRGGRQFMRADDLYKLPKQFEDNRIVIHRQNSHHISPQINSFALKLDGPPLAANFPVKCGLISVNF